MFKMPLLELLAKKREIAVRKILTVHRLLSCLFLFGIVLISQAQTKAEKPPNKAEPKASQSQSIGATVYRNNVESIVLIDVEDSSGRRQGSGVAIRNGVRINTDGQYVPSSTWIVTNAHVVKDSNEVSVMVAGFPVKGKVTFRDTQMDIAFVFLDLTVIKPVEFTESSTLLSPGDVVFAIGAPQGLTRSITEGIVSAIRTIDGIRLVQTSAAISPGSSGGGLFSSAGVLTGVTTFKVVGGDSLNFAVEIAQVRRLLAARAAAEMMKIGINSQYLPSFGDGFVKWVYSAGGETGGTVLDEYEDANNRWMKNELTYDKFNEKQFDIANRYYKLINESKSQSNTSSASNAQNSPSKLVLVCQLFGTSNNSPRTESFEIDFSKSLIEGYPAKITSSMMQYTSKNNKGTEYTMVFDRNAATLTISTEQFPRLLHGSCSKSDRKAF